MHLTRGVAKVCGRAARRSSPQSKSRAPQGRLYSDLAGKVVRVTGGASRIDATIVRRFAQQKSNVVLFDIKADEGRCLARELSNQGLSAHFKRTVALSREIATMLGITPQSHRGSGATRQSVAELAANNPNMRYS
jgi:NAD(P)-dependent dehydrogenase (short-subunit alcohol dehydrogenase family)